MCAKLSCIQPESESLSPGKSIRSGYRVLRCSPRGEERSVNRNQAGRNAKPEGSSVKGSSPVKHTGPWWPSHYVDAKAAPKRNAVRLRWPEGTTGVQDHGMFERLDTELGRSPEGRSRKVRLPRQRFISESGIIPPREVRCSHSSGEVW
jgi:hypothetical protein